MDVLWFYLLIFVVKIGEVSLSTTRIVLITKGEKLIGAIIGFFEVIIWIVLASTVLTNISDDPLKVIVYAFGFAVGNYVGSTLEKKIGLGNSRIEVILNPEYSQTIISSIREHGYGFTEIEGKGAISNRTILIMNVRRNKSENLIELVKSLTTDAVITINEIKPIYGGYGMARK